jgi:molybdopterin synthase sulfur carrier subunit
MRSVVKADFIKIKAMNVHILAFGIVKDIFQKSSIQVDLEGAATISNLKAALEKNYPRLGEPASYMVAVNNEYATSDLVIETKDEIAIIPPVSGG